MRIVRWSYLVAVLTVTVNIESKECNTALDGQIFFADLDTIWRMNPVDNSHEAHISTESSTKFSYSYARNTLYYVEVKTRQVYALKDETTKARVVVAKKSDKWLPSGISVDDVNDKLYLVEHYVGGLYAYDLSSGNGTVVIGTNITKPIDVEIDADEGYLFVLDKYQILRAELDGSNQTPIYQEFKTIKQLYSEDPITADGLVSSMYPVPDQNKAVRSPINIADLTLDVKSKRIYWADPLKRTIESSNYDGENKKVHLQCSNTKKHFRPHVLRPYALLTFSNEVIYWYDKVTKNLFKIVGDKSERILNGVKIHALTVIDCNKQPIVNNPCASSQCQQFCLLSKSSQTGYRCACNVGLELTRDGKTCGPIQDFILFNQESYLRGTSLSDDRKDAIEPNRLYIGHRSKMDFDANSGIVYYAGKVLGEIRLNGTQKKTLLPDLLSNEADDLAYDWTTKNLYYFTSYYNDMKTLSVTNVNDPTYSKILIKNVPSCILPGLVVHPNKGYVFFAKLDRKKKQQKHGSITRLATDGSGLKVIIDLGTVNSIYTLAVDLIEDRIYWSENTTSGEIITRHANLHGEDVRKLDLSTNYLPTKLVIHSSYIYGISNSESVFRVDKNGRNPVTLVNGQKKDNLIFDFKIFSSSLQITQTDHPCKSHSCKKFCFAVPTNTSNLVATCGCPYGEKLADDGVSCVDNSKDEPAFLPCKNKYEKCDMQTA